jgi:hypothetical protein
MNALYQRLKELDADTFQRFCAQLLKERHPGVEIRHVEGASGDMGLDVFTGILAEMPVIWQCKAFSNGIGKSQKQQIRDSLKEAVKNFKPREWILCLSVDMDAKTYSWFQKLTQSYKEKTSIGLFSASDIVHELIHRRPLREHFFPGAAIDIVGLKRLITKTGELTPEELQQLNETNLEDYIERLRERDARFNYEIVFNSEGGPNVANPQRPGLMLSIKRGSQTVNVLARDVAAINANPPKISFSLQGTGLEKYQSLMKTGVSQKFSSEEFTGLNSNWELIAPMINVSGYEVIVGPAASLTQRRIKAQVTFTSSSRTVVYRLLEFAPTRAGTEEAEIESISKVPFKLSFVLPLSPAAAQRSGSMGFEADLVGAEVHAAEKFLSAIEILREGGEISFFSLDLEKELFSGRPSLHPTPQKETYARQLLTYLVQIADVFGVELMLPAEISEEDKQSIASLKKYIDSAVDEANELTISLVKSHENKDSLSTTMSGPSMLRMERPFHDPRPMLFGKEINTGPCALIFDEVLLKDREETLAVFSRAKIGDAVSLSFGVKSVKYELVRTNPS